MVGKLLRVTLGLMLLFAGIAALRFSNDVPDELVERSTFRSLFMINRVNPERTGLVGALFLVIGTLMAITALYEIVTGAH